jgi:hypothetical protein
MDLEIDTDPPSKLEIQKAITGCKISAARTGSILKSSAFSWSVPGAFLFFQILMAFCSRKYSFKSENGIYLPGN